MVAANACVAGLHAWVHAWLHVCMHSYMHVCMHAHPTDAVVEIMADARLLELLEVLARLYEVGEAGDR